MKLLLLFGVLAVLLSALTGLLMIRFMGRMHAPADPRRWAAENKPLVGGLAMFLPFLLALVAQPFFLPPEAALAPFAVCGVLGFMLGLADDALRLRPLAKLSGQITCGVAMMACGLKIELFAQPGLDYFLTLFWMVGMMNSLNMLDNMDGVTGSVSLGVIAAAGAFLAVQAGGAPLLPLTVALAGALVGFLYLNWRPARLFMGDSGSQFLGAVLAVYGVHLFWNIPHWRPDASVWAQCATPVLLFVAPIMDTTFVTVARLARGQSPPVGGRDHTTHHLAYLGVPGRVIPLLYLALTLTGGALALFNPNAWWLHVAFLVTAFGLMAWAYRAGAAARRPSYPAVNAEQPVRVR